MQICNDCGFYIQRGLCRRFPAFIQKKPTEIECGEFKPKPYQDIDVRTETERVAEMDFSPAKEFPCPKCHAKKRFHKKGCSLKEEI